MLDWSRDSPCKTELGASKEVLNTNVNVDLDGLVNLVMFAKYSVKWLLFEREVLSTKAIDE